MRRKQMKEKHAAKLAEAKALHEKIVSEDRDFTPDEQKAYDCLTAECKRIKSQLENEEQLAQLESANQITVGTTGDDAGSIANIEPTRKPKARPYRSGKLQSFKDEQSAFDAGMWLWATFGGSGVARDYCKEHGIGATMGATAGPSGGFLVPEVMTSAIIDLREVYGVFRGETRLITMPSDVYIIPRVSGHVTAYWVGENTEITASDMSFDQVQLTARKLAALTKMSTELSEDAIVSVGDLVTQDIAWKFALAEDQAGFIGDGTSTYGGVTGILPRINDGSHAGSIYTTITGNTAFSTLDLEDFEFTIGKIPNYAIRGGNCKWYFSQAGWAASMLRLQMAAGGTLPGDIRGGTGIGGSFMGFPVVISQVLNSTLTAQTSTVIGGFGDLRMATTMGERRGITAKVLNERYAEYDQVGIMATERIAITAHETGDASTCGPFVAIKTASS